MPSRRGNKYEDVKKQGASKNRKPAAGGDGATEAADANVCDTTGRPPSALVPFQRTLLVAGKGSSATAGSPAAAEQLAGSLDCDCKGVPGSIATAGSPPAPEQLAEILDCDCEGVPAVVNLRYICCLPHCMLLLSRHCVDLGGQPLPQVVSKLHRMMKEQYQASQKKLVEQHLQYKRQALIARKEAETSMEKLKQQYQASQKKLVEQHLQYKRQAVTEVEELRRQSTTAQAHARQLSAEVEALQKASLRHVEEMETLEERLSTSNAQEEAVAADLRLCKEELVAAQSQLAQPYSSSSSAGPASAPGAGAEQHECLDQLSIATEQLAYVMVKGDILQNPAVQHLVEAAMGSLKGTAALVSSWDRDSCAAALHHYVLNTALGIAQQQVDWYQHSAGDVLTKYLACLTSCPESGRTELHVILQQLQQAKSRTLFLVAQQQAPSHPVTREVVVKYVEGIRQYMQGQLEQQLGLTFSYQVCVAWRSELVAVAAAMTRVNLLLASLQSSCPGLQLPAPVPGAPWPGLRCCWRGTPGAGQAAGSAAGA
ncbi:hypothetical protein V8C86DRAFT_3030473 [Haematococcus lacustris]